MNSSRHRPKARADNLQDEIPTILIRFTVVSLTPPPRAAVFFNKTRINGLKRDDQGTGTAPLQHIDAAHTHSPPTALTPAHRRSPSPALTGLVLFLFVFGCLRSRAPTSIQIADDRRTGSPSFAPEPHRGPRFRAVPFRSLRKTYPLYCVWTSAAVEAAACRPLRSGSCLPAAAARWAAPALLWELDRAQHCLENNKKKKYLSVTQYNINKNKINIFIEHKI